MNKLYRSALILPALAATLLPFSVADAQTAGLTIEPDAQLINDNQVLVEGTIACQPGAFVFVNVDLTQNGTQSGGGTSFVCNSFGQEDWSVTVNSFGDIWHKGKAHVFATAGVCTFNCALYSSSRDVHIQE